MIYATIRFYEELNFFLRAHEKKQDIRTEFLLPRSVKDLIESFGVPHVEVDLILVNGVSVGFDYLVQSSDRISVYPVFESLNIAGVTHLRPKPLRNPLFVVDVHLKTLARRLRMLGFDTAFDPEMDDAELAVVSKNEHRILLTRDRQLLMRSNVTHGLYVRNTDPEKQILEIVRRLDLGDLIRPFTRCIRCNGLIRGVNNVEWSSLMDTVPVGVRAWCKTYHVCDCCDTVYWPGSHYKKMCGFVDRIRAAVT